MNQRMDLRAVVPDGYESVAALERHVRRHAPADVLELVKIRASVVNGCGFCVDMHTQAALGHGADARKLFGLTAWWELPWFSERERAALALTDAVTRLDGHGVPDDVYDAAAKAFPAEELANLILAVATINVWNRIAITTKLPPPA